jgi:AcrR family transcriptional regulator
MSRKSAPQAKRPQLSAERIAAAALALADKSGLDGLSFRVLAKGLGCEAMSLYHYFPSKAELLDAMVNMCLAEMDLKAEAQVWQDRLRSISREYRKMALRHPGFFPFIAVYRMNSYNGLAMLNQVLSTFEATGLDAESRARNFRVFGYFLTGACLDETIGYARGPSSAKPVPADEARKLFPAIMSVGPFFAVEHHERTFEKGLEMMIHSIEQEVAAASAS